MSSSNDLFVSPRIRIPAKELSAQFVRSSGPGGQNVNKSNTKVILSWNFKESTLSSAIKQRFLNRYPHKVSSDGIVNISSSTSRQQIQNLKLCREKLIELILSVQFAPKPRLKVKTPRAVKEKRLSNKRHRAEKKHNRRVRID